MGRTLPNLAYHHSPVILPLLTRLWLWANTNGEIIGMLCEKGVWEEILYLRLGDPTVKNCRALTNVRKFVFLTISNFNIHLLWGVLYAPSLITPSRKKNCCLETRYFMKLFLKSVHTQQKHINEKKMNDVKTIIIYIPTEKRYFYENVLTWPLQLHFRLLS